MGNGHGQLLGITNKRSSSSSSVTQPQPFIRSAPPKPAPHDHLEYDQVWRQTALEATMVWVVAMFLSTILLSTNVTAAKAGNTQLLIAGYTLLITALVATIVSTILYTRRLLYMVLYHKDEYDGHFFLLVKAPLWLNYTLYGFFIVIGIAAVAINYSYASDSKLTSTESAIVYAGVSAFVIAFAAACVSAFAVRRYSQYFIK